MELVITDDLMIGEKRGITGAGARILASAVTAGGHAGSGALIAWAQPPQARCRLLCVPHAGMGAALFRPWSSLLGDDVELLAARLPGRETRFAEPPLHSMADVIRDLTAAYRSCPALPTVFLGHCSGALIAFELARALRDDEAHAPIGLIVCAQAPPTVNGEAPPTANGEAQPWHTLPDEKLRALLAELDPTAPPLDDELFELCAPLVRADFEVAETYRPRAEQPLSIPITALLGSDDEWFTARDASAWRDWTRGSFDGVTIPGSHLLLERWDEVAHAVRGFLDDAVGPRPSG